MPNLSAFAVETRQSYETKSRRAHICNSGYPSCGPAVNHRNIEAGWSCVLAVAAMGRTIWIADAHCDDGKRYVVRADEKLTAFLELESVIRIRGKLS